MGLTGEQGILVRLAASTAVAALVHDRIRPHMAPQADTFPLLTYKRVSAKHEHNMNGASGLCVTQVRIGGYAEKYTDMIALREAVRMTLDGYRGVVSIGGQDVTIQKCFIDSDDETFVDPDDASQTGIYGFGMDLSVAYNEQIPTFGV